MASFEAIHELITLLKNVSFYKSFAKYCFRKNLEKNELKESQLMCVL